MHCKHVCNHNVPILSHLTKIYTMKRQAKQKENFLIQSTSSHRKCFMKKLFLKVPITGTQLRWSLLFNKVASLKSCKFIKETPPRVFSCEHCKIVKNIYFKEHPRTAASYYQPSNNLRLKHEKAFNLLSSFSRQISYKKLLLNNY